MNHVHFDLVHQETLSILGIAAGELRVFQSSSKVQKPYMATVDGEDVRDSTGRIRRFATINGAKQYALYNL